MRRSRQSHTGRRFTRVRARRTVRSRRIARVAVFVLLAATVCGCALVRPSTTRLLGAARTNPAPLPAGDLSVPNGPPETHATSRQAGSAQTDHPVTAGSAAAGSPSAARLIDEWAAMDLPGWEEEGKVTAPRVILAKLHRGADVESVNDYLAAAEPWAGTGSTWSLRPNGDYDFSLPPLTAILYLYGDRPDLLYPATRDHLVSVLLNQEGGRFRTTVPGSLGLVTETENHILMTEGSRYLKNQWLAENGSSERRHDNVANGLEEKLVRFMHEIETSGPYEFNSHPYSGYTAMALLTLEAFAAEPVAAAARRLLHTMNYEYALGSLTLRRFAVFRRQPSRSDCTDLTDHPHTSMMRVWVSLATGEDIPVEHNTHQAVYAALMPYRLPLPILETATGVIRHHYVRIGRGPGSSPELYSAGPGYLISSGGTGRESLTLIVARPITVLLANGATDLSELFSVGGEGDYRTWNNTGVVPGFAVARSPARVPGDSTPVASGETWRVFAQLLPAAGHGADAAPAGRTVLIAVADTGTAAALYVRDAIGTDAHDLLTALEAGADAARLESGSARLPDGRTVDFDLNADADTWVIEPVDGRAVDRDLTGWPRLSGEIRR